MSEKVNHPAHYNKGKIEVIDYIEDQGMGLDFCLGNAIKYISRAKHKKNMKEDLRKAIWYLQRVIDTDNKNKLKSSFECGLNTGYEPIEPITGLYTTLER